MAKINVYQHAFNVGVQDKKHLARVDLERMRLASEQQTNLLALTTGPGFMRPGLEFISATDSDAVCKLKEFVFGATDAALLEFTNLSMRVRNNDVLVTRPAVTAAVTSGTFSASTGWTLTATDGATCTISGGFLNLTAAARGSTASATQTVAVSQQGTEHALRIVIDRGPVTFRCGSSSGGDEYIPETTLATGTHSLSFTPSAANFYIELKSSLRPLKRVDSITVEAAGVMKLPTIWGASDLGLMRTSQSADVVFVACRGKKQQRIERRSPRSWSVVNYVTNDGPFTLDRTRAVKLKPSVTEGNGTLTSDGPFFNSGHVGALFSLSHDGVRRVTGLAANGTYTDPFRVTGVQDSAEPPTYDDRVWTYSVSGTWAGTLRWYRSFDGPDRGFKTHKNALGSGTVDITTNLGTTANEDNDDNAIIWYKIGFDESSYTSGSANITVTYDGGGGSGICRVTSYNSPTSVNIEILSPFYGTGTTSEWREGEWSDNQLYPSAVAFSDGRLIWSAGDRFWASVSDGFDSFDDTVEGDSGPIIRSIATGGVNSAQWLLGLQRLLVGTEGNVCTVKSTSFDEPLTPANNSIKESSSTGAAPVEPVKIDGNGLFVERSGTALMELSFDGTSGDYVVTQLSKLVTEIFQVGVKQIAIQRRPDTRLWVVMDDGLCVCVIYEPLEEVLAFIPVETDGEFESVAVLPSAKQDRVYFAVQRTVNAATVRHVEKMALDSEIKPSTLCKVMDAFKSGTNSPASATINVGTHLIGKTVVVWADGAPMETSPGVRAEYVVDGSGNITVGTPVTDWVTGLPYRMRYKSARLAYGAEGGTAMLQKKKVDQIGVIMTDFVRAGIKYGSRFDDATHPLYPLPIQKDGKTAPAIVLSDVAEEEPFLFPGDWNTDSRVCLEVNSPYTASFLGLTLGITTNG